MAIIQDNQRSSKLVKKRWRLKKSWLVWGVLFLIGLFTAIAINAGVPDKIEHAISIVENNYKSWFSQQDTSNPLLLFGFAFVGGLIASISPCILAMLPINLSYIGTLKIKSRLDALIKVSLFVLGVIIVLSLLGLVSSFAGAVMIEYRGHINIAVGAIVILMGLSLLGIFQLPLPQFNLNVAGVGPFGVGLTYGLVSSPCASPVLFAVLATAAATGSQLLATLTMFSYALGYTIVIFFSSLMTGLAKQTRLLLNHSEAIVRFGSIALIITGLYYLTTGILWF